MQNGADENNFNFYIPPRMLSAALDMLMYADINEQWIALSVAIPVEMKQQKHWCVYGRRPKLGLLLRMRWRLIIGAWSMGLVSRQLKKLAKL